MLEVASVSFHDSQRARVSVQDRVLVMGDGLIGLLVAQAARSIGAHVVLAGHHADRLKIAKTLGVDVVTNYSTRAAEQIVKQHAPYSVIFECSGGQAMDWI